MAGSGCPRGRSGCEKVWGSGRQKGWEASGLRQPRGPGCEGQIQVRVRGLLRGQQGAWVSPVGSAQGQAWGQQGCGCEGLMQGGEGVEGWVGAG